MQISAFLTFAVASLVCLAQAKTFPNAPSVLRRSVHKGSKFSHLQVSKRQLLERSHQKRSPEPTPTPTSSNGESESRRFRRQSDSSASLRNKIYQYLTNCHSGLQERVANIQSLCGATTRQNAQQTAWKLVAELQAILALLVTCVSSIKGCPDEPTPSGVPGENISCAQIAQLIYQIMVLIKTCLMQISTTGRQFSIIHTTCNDPMNQITSRLSNCVSAVGSLVPDLPSQVTRMLGGQNMPQFFNSVGYGMDQVLSALQFPA
ncbi:secreted protein [Melampsora americana]|nr:secreted protein [Melampsora americana]